MRSGKASTKGGKALAAAAILGGIGAATTVVFANAGPPPAARNITSRLFDQKIFTPYGFAYGKIKIETTDGNQVKLIVPEATETPGRGPMQEIRTTGRFDLTSEHVFRQHSWRRVQLRRC